MEETDVALLLFARSWGIYDSGELRVFHDTELAHHPRPEITAGVVANIALYAFLHYPVHLWAWGLLQLGNTVWFCLRMGRWKGIMRGLVSIPSECIQHRKLRQPLPHKVVCEFLKYRRAQTLA